MSNQVYRKRAIDGLDVGMGVAALILYLFLTLFYHAGDADWAMGVILFASPFLFAWACMVEDGWRRVVYAFDPRRQFWAFLGDMVCIAPIVYLATKYAHHSWWAQQWWWWGLSAPVLALLGSLAFHFGTNKNGYPSNPTAIDSPSYRIHAIVTYPVLFGAVIAYVVPHVLNVWSHGYARWMLAFGVLWGLFCVFDMMRESPKWLNHPKFGGFFRYFKIDRDRIHIAWDKQRGEPLYRW